MRSFKLAAALAVASLTTLAATPAKAGPAVGVDLEAALPIVKPSHVSSGYAGNLRLGYKLNLLVLSITPEIGGGYTGLQGDLAPGIVRGFVGGRVAVGALVQFGVYGHIGYAHVSYDEFRGTKIDGRSAPTYDGGLTLDLTVLPKIDVGVHGGYQLVAGSDNQRPIATLNAGLHAAIIF